MSDEAPTNDQIAEASVWLTEQIGNLIEGESTAAVYIAIANILGHGEKHADRPDRQALFRILDRGIDEYIRRNS